MHGGLQLGCLRNVHPVRGGGRWVIPALASIDINTQPAILAIRVWAIYERRRSILILLLLCWVASYGTSIAIAALRAKVGNLMRHPDHVPG